jgi:hypothetical protein
MDFVYLFSLLLVWLVLKAHHKKASDKGSVSEGLLFETHMLPRPICFQRIIILTLE